MSETTAAAQQRGATSMSKNESENKSKGTGVTVSRRDFAKTSVAAGAAVALPTSLRAEVATETAATKITPPSTYGRNLKPSLPPDLGGYGGPVTPTDPGPASPARQDYPGGWREHTTIPGEYYVDPKHYEADERFLVENLWIYTDHHSRIPNPGDFYVFEFGRNESVIILRANDGTVKGFHNVCRHRGSRLCRHDADSKPSDPRLSVKQLGQAGSSPVFRCPYHAWTYDTDGALIYAYGMQDDFNPADNGLIPCHLEVVEGSIFINLSQAASPPPIEPVVGEMRAMTKRYGVADLKVVAREQYAIKANWKLALENFLECYHCGPSHTSLVTTHHWSQEGTQEQYVQQSAQVREWVPEKARRERDSSYGMSGDGSTRYRPETSGLLNPGYVTGSMDGKPVAPLLPNIDEWNHETQVVATAHSTGYWQCYDDHIAVARFTPRDVDRSEAEIIWLVHPDAVEGRDYDPDNVKALWHVTIQEDIWITANNHAGIRSGAYSSGHYSGSETGPAGFMQWYMSEVVKSGD